METTTGEKLVIVRPGFFNTNQGPDFLDARVIIDRNAWAGNIELHVRASDWKKHQHSADPNYKNIILHVVWIDDDEYPFHEIPTLILSDRVPKILLQQYDQWMNNSHFIPCGKYVIHAKEITWISWKERLLVERLERKCMQIRLMLEQNNYDWDETMWWLLARYFGSPVNADAFEELARSISCRMVLNSNAEQLEILFNERVGQLNIPLHFLRMRPASFPPVKLRQLAVFVSAQKELFQTIICSDDVKQLKQIFPPIIMINVVAPLLFAHGRVYGNEYHVVRSIDILNALPAEKNNIISKYKKLGSVCDNAAASQSLIELKTQYCDQRRCLECAVGNAILKKSFMQELSS